MSAQGITITIGDIHGELDQLRLLLSRLPPLTENDTLLFLGDYVDRGPSSAQVIEFLRASLPTHIPASVVLLRGNHEDAWLRVVRQGWPEFVFPAANGCRQCMRSFLGPEPTDREQLKQEFDALFSGAFLPPDVLQWFGQRPYWYEDQHAIYVHAGLPRVEGQWLHPADAPDQSRLLWARDPEFFRDYRGKHVVCGHTITSCLPQELSTHTPDDPTDLWAGPRVTAVDTGCGKAGFLSALELPARTVYDSR